jgi:hypothetical protein
MAVKSSQKKKDDSLKNKKEIEKQKSSNDKKKTVKKDEEKNILEEETIKEEIILPKKKKSYYFIIIIVMLCGLIYLMLPKIKIIGNEKVTIRYNQLYEDPGYKGRWLFKDISPNMKVTSNLNNTKVGTYSIKYQFKFAFFNISKKRIIKVIDDVDPQIIIDSNEINICPNSEIPEIKIEIHNHYHGNIDTLTINE